MPLRSKRASSRTINNNSTEIMGTTSSRHYSENSSRSIPDSCFWTRDFLLSASMAVIQPSSGKVLVVNDTKRGSWFLPRGRKDIGETLEQCALREAYEESGYRVEFLPLHLPSRAPAPPDRPNARLEKMVSEPVFITTSDIGPRRYGNRVDQGWQYITFCYVGQIPADAVREESTGMPDEVNYVGTLLGLNEALSRLNGLEAHIMKVAYLHWRETVEIEQELLARESDRRQHPSRHHSNSRDAAGVPNSEPGVSTLAAD